MSKKEEKIRLYRGEEKEGSGEGVPDWVKQDLAYQKSEQARGRWFTDDLKEAEWYIKNEYPNGKIVVVDVPKEIADRYRVSQLRKVGGKTVEENPFAFSLRPEKEYFLPKHIANQKRDYIDSKSMKKERGLEEKIAVFILLSLIGIVISFNSLNATGFAISNFSQASPALSGFVLIIAGLIGIFLVLKR